jgi:hypothetical protein
MINVASGSLSKHSKTTFAIENSWASLNSEGLGVSKSAVALIKLITV